MLVQIFGNSKGKSKKSRKKSTTKKKAVTPKKNTPKQIAPKFSDAERAAYHYGVSASLSNGGVPLLTTKQQDKLSPKVLKSYNNGLNGKGGKR